MKEHSVCCAHLLRNLRCAFYTVTMSLVQCERANGRLTARVLLTFVRRERPPDAGLMAGAFTEVKSRTSCCRESRAARSGARGLRQRRILFHGCAVLVRERAGPLRLRRPHGRPVLLTNRCGGSIGTRWTAPSSARTAGAGAGAAVDLIAADRPAGPVGSDAFQSEGDVLSDAYVNNFIFLPD